MKYTIFLLVFHITACNFIKNPNQMICMAQLQGYSLLKNNKTAKNSYFKLKYLKIKTKLEKKKIKKIIHDQFPGPLSILLVYEDAEKDH